MADYRTIVTAIKAVLKSVADSGVVHSYERQATDDAKFIELFLDRSRGQIRGWEITRRAVTEHLAGVTLRHHQFVLAGYMSLQDDKESSPTFQTLCDTVCTAFRTAAAPNGSNWEYRNGDAPNDSCVQIPLIDDRTFGNVLCHHAEIQLSITERII